MKIRRYHYRDMQKWPIDSTRFLIPTIVVRGFGGRYSIVFVFWVWKICFDINATPDQTADQGCSVEGMGDLWRPAKTAPRDGSEFIAMNKETGETHPMRCYGVWGFAREDVKPKKTKQPFGTGRELDNESTTFRFTHWRVNATRTDSFGDADGCDLTHKKGY